MDPFKIGLRNLIGITAPGAIVLLALGYGLLSLVRVINPGLPILTQLKDGQWFALWSPSSW
jgi:hypothetical protein